jgi:hypothetical protein
MIKKPEMIEGSEAFRRFRDGMKAVPSRTACRGAKANRGTSRAVGPEPEPARA